MTALSTPSTPVTGPLVAQPLKEIVRALFKWEFWLTLAWVDIRGRYRRTVLGPFWSALNSLFFVCILSVVYSLLWRIDLAEFLPFVAGGYFVWVFFSQTTTESCQAFHVYGETLKTVPVPPIAMLFRVIARNLMVFLHNFLIFILIALLLGRPMSMIPLALPGVILTALWCLGCGVCLAFLCARFRDFEQVVQSVLLTLFFVTPILWQAKLLPENRAFLAELNPVYHFLRLARDPLLGNVPPMRSVVIASLLAAGALALGAFVYVRLRAKLAYWL